MKNTFPAMLVLIVLTLGRIGGAEPIGSTFIYQGRLSESGAAAHGSYDFAFALYPGAEGGAPLTPALTNRAATVVDGTFTVPLDFSPNPFDGSALWLEVWVRKASGIAAFTPLSPRQALRTVPYATYSSKAASLVGPLPDAQLSTNVARLNVNQIFSGNVQFQGGLRVGSSNASTALLVNGSIVASALSGDGAGLSNLTASSLGTRLLERYWRTPIPFVTVTNAGNEPDANGKGAVARNFRIGKYEINNQQYAAFLNTVAAGDPHQLYSTNMTADRHGGILRSGSPGDYSYRPKPGMEHHPVVWVDYHDAARFCNWLHNGQPGGSQDQTTTEDGAYTLTADGIRANAITRKAGARFWIPNDDEWYKAAYHQPAEQGGDISGYWIYPTRSNDTPFSEPPPGNVNSVNACCETDRMATDVGAYLKSPSPYGTYDQGGNVEEWTEEVIYMTSRRLRGGSWSYNEFYSRSSDFEFDTPDYDAEGIGFRVAGEAEP